MMFHSFLNIGINQVLILKSAFLPMLKERIYLCNPQKASVNVCLMKTLKSTVINTVIVFVTYLKKNLK